MVKRKKRLSVVDIFCLGLNAIIGSGIFIFPGTLAALMGPASFCAFFVCGILLTAVALCYAELGAMYPGNGGSALYARKAFGEDAGFGVGLIAWAAAILSWSAVASVLAGYLSAYLPSGLSGQWLGKSAAAGLVLIFGIVNYRGIKPGARIVNTLTAAKLLPLGIFVLALLPSVRFDNFIPFYGGERNFGYAIFLALWALQGFEVAPVPAGESENPQRDVPLGVVGSLLSAAFFYTLIQGVAVGAYPGLAESSDKPLVDAAAFVLGGGGGWLLTVGGGISMLGFVAGAALGAPRYLSAIGETSLRRCALGAIHARFRTPHRAVAATTGAAIMMILLFDFSKLIDLSNLAVVSQYFCTCLAAAMLRRREPHAVRPFRMQYAGFVVCVGGGVSLWLMTMVTRMELAGCAGLLAAGYFLRRIIDGGRK